MLNPLHVTPKNITQYKQNKPSLVAKDFEYYGIHPDITLRILMARGIYKWLAVRRRLIGLKHEWRNLVTDTIKEIRKAKKERDRDRIHYLRGYLRAYEEMRFEIKGLCRSNRWQFQDNDWKSTDIIKNGHPEERSQSRK